MKALAKNVLRRTGFKLERVDLLEESIPAEYNHSLFLPRVYRGALHRYLYFKDMLESVRDTPGDIVECGVSIGHGALIFSLLGEWIGVERDYYGFDSFEGFPEPTARDEKTPITGKGFWANPPETVLKVLRDGRLREDFIRDRMHLVRGWFQDTLPKYEGKIALLHLDCDLYESYKLALNTLYDKVQAGGVILFDEYADDRWPGARKAIDEFFADKMEKPKPDAKCDWKFHVRKPA